MMLNVGLDTLIMSRVPPHPNAPGNCWVQVSSQRGDVDPLLVVEDWTLIAVVIQFLLQRRDCDERVLRDHTFTLLSFNFGKYANAFWPIGPLIDKDAASAKAKADK